jgi:transcriptional regulator with XRE-family HTH domain
VDSTLIRRVSFWRREAARVGNTNGGTTTPHKIMVLRGRHLAGLLLERRSALGLTQEEAAQAIGVSRREYGRWERRVVIVPHANKRASLASFLGCEIRDLNDILSVNDDASLSADSERVLNRVRELLTHYASDGDGDGGGTTTTKGKR